MKTMIERLLALQTLLRLGENTSPEQKQQIEELRAGIPTPILAHFLRQLATGRRGIAFVRRGICNECHIRVAQAMAHTLDEADDLVLCENCGAYLVLAPEEQATAAAPKVDVPVRKRRVAKKVPAAGSIVSEVASQLASGPLN
jgi:hypothetical protein